MAGPSWKKDRRDTDRSACTSHPQPDTSRDTTGDIHYLEQSVNLEEASSQLLRD